MSSTFSVSGSLKLSRVWAQYLIILVYLMNIKSIIDNSFGNELIIQM